MKVLRASRTGRDGFTLVELMIVVAIIGVLAALAIYGVARYLKHSKTAEATRVLGVIETGEEVQYERETPFGAVDSSTFVHTFCPNAPPTPAAVPAGSKQTVTSTPGSGLGYDADGWKCLKFNMADPQFYQYEVVNNGATSLGALFTASAHGDLDANGTQSTFIVVGRGGTFGDEERDSYTIVNEDE
jgi:type IV pilus assembly protein PilA